jgi:hypothetical protein
MFAASPGPENVVALRMAALHNDDCRGVVGEPQLSNYIPSDCSQLHRFLVGKGWTASGEIPFERCEESNLDFNASHLTSVHAS